jgi:penicillin amidase
LPGSLQAGGTVSSYRLIADCADWDASLSSIPGGQSGQRGSSHYADQVEAWRRVAYHPLAYSRPAVQRFARHTLTLTPAA